MIEIVEYKSDWPDEFQALAADLRQILGDRALAIHHIGSTSVHGLCAKDVIDAQITVAALDPRILDDLIHVGYTQCNAKVDHCPPGMSLPADELKKMMVNGPGRRANIHIRVQGRFNQQYPLLCRDYLRTHKSAADAYGRVKQELARYFPDDVGAYYDIKDPVFDILMAGARERAVTIAWSEPISDL